MSARSSLMKISPLIALVSAFALTGCRIGGDITAQPAAEAAPVPYVPIPTIAIPSTSPYYSQGSSLTITGLCAQGQLVELTGDSSASTVCLNSSYTFSIPRTNDGIYSFLIHQRDSSQNVSPAVAQVWVRKTSIPQPSLIVPATATFASALPFITLTGACESNATVSLGVDASGAMMCTNATFSFNVPKVADGDYTIVVTQTDPAGNHASTQVVWNKHAIAAVPSAPNLKAGVAQSIQLSGGSGTYTVSLSTNASGATLSSSSASATTPFTYTAGPSANKTDVIHVVDSLGSTLDIPVTTAPNTADHLKIIAGNAQSKTIGTVLTTNPKVQIVDRYGNGVPNQKVRFQVTVGDAKIVGPSIITSDTSGYAQITLRMGISHLQNTIYVSSATSALPDLAGSGNPVLKITENSSVNASGTGNFGLSFPTVASPGQIVTANFGAAHTDTTHQDMAILNTSGTNTINILKNLGNGLYSSSVISTCPGPQAIAAADFNGDLLVDLAVVCNSGVVAIHKGNIDGSFQSPLTYTSAPGPVSVVTGDFRNSGKIDLAIASSNGVIELQFNNGDGSFQSPFIIANQGSFTPKAMKAVDIDKDGVPDLVVINDTPQNSISYLHNLNDHAGGFAPNIDLPTGTAPSDLAIGDFNSDGYPDVAVVNSADNTLGIFLNDSGTHALTGMQTIPTGSQPTVLAAADLSASGYVRDIAVVNSAAPNIGLFPNMTTPGSMSVTFDAMVTFDYQTAPSAISFVSFNGDTKPDLAASVVGAPSSIQVRAGKGSYQFGNDIGTGNGPAAIATGFITGGTYTDAAVVNQTSSTISIFKGVGQGQFTLFGTVNTNIAPVAVALADMDGDGNLDLVVVSKTSKTVSVFLGNGDGTFKPSIDTSVGVAPASVVVRDFNGDGIPDVAVSNTQSGTVSILLGVGDGSLNAKVDYATGNGPVGLDAADLNGDGVLDLVVADSTDNAIGVLLGIGDGTFRAVTQYAVGADPIDLKVIDMNGDGIPDVAALNGGDITVSIMRGVGDGSFVARSTLSPGGSDVKALAAGDFHGTGRVDLVVTNGDATASAFQGRGDGTFQNPITLQSNNTGAGFGALVTTDLNKDGIIDLLILDASDNVMETWMGQ